MAKSENLKDEDKYKIVAEEVKKVNDLIRGHDKLIEAIGRL